MPRLSMQSMELSLPRVRNEIKQNFDTAFRRYGDYDQGIEKAEVSIDQQHNHRNEMQLKAKSQITSP